MQIRSRAALAAALVGATISGLALSACAPGGASSGDEDDADTIHIVGFAVPEAANKNIATEFNKTPEGEGVTFQTSYGLRVTRAVRSPPASRPTTSTSRVPTDVTRLVDEGLVADDWDAGENKGVVSRSVVVFGVRDGNPKNIKTWDDLIKPGVEIVTPNPASSGAARWNALAAYGQVISDGGTEEEATDYVNKFFKNVVSLPGSGRDATTAFLGGTGDVLMAYENEAILAAPERRGLRLRHPRHHAADRERGRDPRGRLRAVAGVAGLRPLRRGPEAVRARPASARSATTSTTAARSRARPTRPTRSPRSRRC